MRKYGTDKFVFEVLEEVEPEKLKEAEQKFIETLKPTYNQMNADGLNIDKYKESQKKYQKSDKYKKYQKEYHKKYQKEYNKKYNKEYQKSDKGKESQKKYQNKYQNQLCCYNGETLTLNALRIRFKRQGIPHPVIEAKKYLLQR